MRVKHPYVLLIFFQLGRSLAASLKDLAVSKRSRRITERLEGTLLFFLQTKRKRTLLKEGLPLALLLLIQRILSSLLWTLVSQRLGRPRNPPWLGLNLPNPKTRNPSRCNPIQLPKYSTFTPNDEWPTQALGTQGCRSRLSGGSSTTTSRLCSTFSRPLRVLGRSTLLVRVKNRC